MGIAEIVASGRRLVEGTLLDRCAIMDRVVVADASGGSTEIYVARPTDYACRFVRMLDTAGPRLSNLRDESGSLEGYASLSLLLPLNIPVSEQCKVWSADGRAFLVVGNETPPSILVTQQRVLLRELGVAY